jgi:hypothetical protein
MADKGVIIVLVMVVIIIAYMLNKKENMSKKDELIQKCGLNKDNMDKIKENIKIIESEINNNFSINKLMDPKIEKLIKENIDIITSYTPEQMNCILNQTPESKQKLCNSLQMSQMLQSQHTDLNKVIDKYVMNVLKLRKYLLKNIIYNLNKECLNITDKKKLIEAHITEYNKTITRMFQVSYIYPSEYKDILNML